MEPIIVNYDSYVDKLIADNRVLIFSKTLCPFCIKVKDLFNELGVAYKSIEFDKIENADEIHQVVKNKTGKTSVPQVYINRNYVGGCDDTYAAQESGKLGELLKAAIYDNDLIVIGGSGDLAASKNRLEIMEQKNLDNKEREEKLLFATAKFRCLLDNEQDSCSDCFHELIDVLDECDSYKTGKLVSQACMFSYNIDFNNIINFKE